ncbi:MAG TPA: hypothetical protein VMR33_20480 [Candidatus Baltobacteraceae bacterium]|jgi:hypothetical protein|nr:hypothetical protein [Candidatus Baltobacteraceae bacterium]
MTSPNFVPVVVGALVVWRIYSRMRRNIGRQPLRPKRLVTRIVVYAVLTCLIAVFSVMHPSLLLGLGGGLALGLPLAWVGLKLTQFEANAEGRFYTPNSYIGSALTILLAARLAYRLIALSNIAAAPAQPPALMHSPLTFCVFGLLAGYYMAYYLGVLARSRKVLS